MKDTDLFLSHVLKEGAEASVQMVRILPLDSIFVRWLMTSRRSNLRSWKQVWFLLY